MAKMRPRPSVYDKDFIAANQVILMGNFWRKMGGCEITDCIFPGGPRRQPDRGHQAGAAGAGTSRKQEENNYFCAKVVIQ